MTTFNERVATLADDLKTLFYASLQSSFPGFRAPQGSPTVGRGEAHAQISAETNVRLELTDEALTIREAELRGIGRYDAVAATVQATYTASDTGSHTVFGGDRVQVTSPSGVVTQWLVQEDVTFSGGATTTGAVTLVCQTPGEAANGTTGTALAVQPKPSWLASITLVGSATGGVDEEGYADFLDRVGPEFTVGTGLIVKADQLQVRAAGHPLVGRALALRTYKPGGPNPSAGDMTVALAALDRVSPVSAAHGDVEAYATADCNTIHAVDFDDHPLVIELDVVKHDDWDATVAEDQVKDALVAWALDWGMRPVGNTQSMTVEDTVRLDQIASVANNQTSIRYPVFSSVKVGVDGGSVTHSDKTLTGDFPLATLARADITVNVS